MKNSKEAWICFRRIIFILFLIFLINYFMSTTGYYEKKINEKTILTEEKIKEFEQDIQEGKEVDVKDYLKEEYKDTSNFASKTGYKVSETVNDFVTNKAIQVFKLLGKLFS